MRRLTMIGIAVVLVFAVSSATGADSFDVRLVSQTTNNITLGWDAQPGYGYLFSSGGMLRSRTNDPSRTTVQFAKVTPASYDIDVIVKGSNGHYPVVASDTTPPVVSVTAPANGATVSGTVPVTVTATDNIGVTRVEFVRDGTLFATDTTSPYSTSLNTTTVANGSHTLGARAFDAAGNIGTATNITVTVNNVAPPPPQCSDLIDNDADGKIDLADPGCSSASDDDETDPIVTTGFPDASNTGVPAGTTLTSYTGPSNVTVANTVITGKTIGCIQVSASGVVIRNSRISCGSFYAILAETNTGTPLLIEDSDIDCQNGNGTGISSSNFTARRVDITGCENGLNVDRNVTIEDSYIHSLYNGGAAHLDGIQFGPFISANNITIRHNTIYGMGADGSFGTSAIIDHSFNANTNVLIDHNLLAGGAFTLYCSIGFTGTNYVVSNNHFSTRFKSTVGFYGPSSDCGDQTQSGNVIDETGQPLHLG